jgi:parallel beta-helix repeat protein/putative cofactor-binding repeat protein
MNSNFSRKLLLMTSFLFLFISIDAQAQTIRRVPADHPTIQQAINASVNGDTVLVAPGTYVENITFLGKAITVTSESGPQLTIVDGNRAGSVVTFQSGEGSASVLSGFTLRNGFSGFFPGTGDGGGIAMFSASPTIMNNIITANGAIFDGGGISIGAGAPTVVNNTISNNSSCNGSGISVAFSSAVIRGNTIRNNFRSGCSGGIGGGGIVIRGASQAQILDNIISDNQMFSSGGGISLFAAGTPTIRGNTISGNMSLEGGGISMFNFSDALIVQNVITGNKATFEGGGIFWLVPAGTRGPRLVNNTIADNDAQEGSGIFADGFDAQTELVNNIIVAKEGQIALFCGGFNDPNTPIIRFNNVFSPQGMAYGGICPDKTGMDGNISADPLFVDPANGNYHLQPNSPAIDAGDNSAPDLPATDFDGDPRILDGDGDGLAIVDMGIDEVFAAGPAFDICIQSGREILRINSASGDYEFTNCDGITLTGTGTIRGKGCTITLQHNAPDRRILAMVNTCQNKGTVSVQILFPRRTFNISDLNIRDGCGCN